MTSVLLLPPALDSHSFEQVFGQLATLAPSAPVTVDARACTFSTPFGLTALLAVAEVRPTKPRLLVPEDAKNIAHWVRSGFFVHAHELYSVEGTLPERSALKQHPMLLELSKVTRGPGRQSSIGAIAKKLGDLLASPMNLETVVANDLVQALSEWCTGTTELAGGSEWVMAQVYRFENTGTTRFVIDMAICDSTVALYDRKSPVDDFVAISHRMWRTDGTLTVRSGTGRYRIAPPWDDEEPARVHDLVSFPGTQMQITFPDRLVA